MKMANDMSFENNHFFDILTINPMLSINLSANTEIPYYASAKLYCGFPLKLNSMLVAKVCLFIAWHC